MKPVAINPFNIGSMIADGLMPFGCAAVRAGAGTVKAAPCTATAYNNIGIARDDLVHKTVDGFYSKYDPVPLIDAGTCRVWITPNDTTAAGILAGDYLDMAVLGGANTLPVGVFEESGAQAGQTRVNTSMARALEDVTLPDCEIPDDVAVGDTEVTLSAPEMLNLDLSIGDYILLEDVSANVQVNRVAALTTTVITLQLATNVALTAVDGDLVHKLTQCEVMLL